MEGGISSCQLNVELLIEIVARGERVNHCPVTSET